jgi:hypothetical protein
MLSLSVARTRAECSLCVTVAESNAIATTSSKAHADDRQPLRKYSCQLLLLESRENISDCWSIAVVFGRHNHDPATSPSAHPSRKMLKVQQRESLHLPSVGYLTTNYWLHLPPAGGRRNSIYERHLQRGTEGLQGNKTFLLRLVHLLPS